MAYFSYIALKNNKNIVKGRVEADNIRDAREAIRRQGLLPTRVTDESTQANKGSAGANGPKVKTVRLPALSLKDKIDFTSTLQTLMSTGIPIIETLVFLENNAESKKIRVLSLELRRNIIAGSTLGETVEKYKNVFGRVFVGLVKAGEDSGELDKTLERMLQLFKKQDATKGKVIGALLYPVFVIIVAIIVVIVMLMFVFPAFEGMFSSMGAELPVVTQMCINMGNFMKKFWIVPIVAPVALVFAVRQMFVVPAIKKEIDKAVLKVPLLSKLIEFSNFSNFIAVMQVAYDAGIPIIDCLYLSNLTIDNFVLKDAIIRAAAKVQQGTHLSVALRSTEKIPPMVLFMIATGEQSGRLGELLYHCAEYIDRKLDAVIDTFTKMMEPIMLIVIGAIVLFLGLALYMPLFGLYSNI
ncbi:MAG: type II secretion system F family protein [Cyanobacteria bacterium SIG30]|nr:type II secretion system F family protein [Cyanobacteria bacterium SIG30]